MKRIINKVIESIKYLINLRVKIEEIQFNQGLIIQKLNMILNLQSVENNEYKIFSQWGEDGIIQHLTSNINIKNKTFIEFGIENFSESNCRYLMFKDNWSGFVIDGSESNIRSLKKSYYYWKYDLESLCAYIDAENINKLLEKSKFDHELGILSIDIDGNDYFIFESINLYKPSIVICEINALFGLRPISIPYDKDFNRTKAHFSNLYFGASLSAITYIANKKGYELVGTTHNMGNAFFVKRELLNDVIRSVSCEDVFMMSKERQSRGRDGNLNLIPALERYDQIKGLPVYNVVTNTLESL